MEKIKFYIELNRAKPINQKIDYLHTCLRYTVGDTFYLIDMDGDGLLHIRLDKREIDNYHIEVDPFDFIKKCTDYEYAKLITPEVFKLTIWSNLDIE